MNSNRLRPFFTYYGGKNRAAPKYPAPIHDKIVEPFAGSAGYAMLNPHKDVLLNDLDPVICGTWDYLIHATESEIRSLPLYDGTWETVDDLHHLPQEARWLIGWWLNAASVAPCKRPSAWMRGGTRPGGFWGEMVRERIASQLQAIRHWEIRCGSYEGLPNDDATWFVDPPYEGAGKIYKRSQIEYQYMSEWCQQLNGQVIVCENEGATWLPFREHATIQASRGTKRTGVSKEVIWTKENA